MPTNTSYDPQNVNDYEKSKLIKDAKGFSGIAVAGQITNLDFTLTDDMLVTNGVFLAKGAAQGDKVDFQVLMGEEIVDQFVTNWFLNPDATEQPIPKSNYPAKLPAGLTLRVVYHSTGLLNVWMAVNYDAEKVLI